MKTPVISLLLAAFGLFAACLPGQAEQSRFVSTHQYGQAYACAGIVVLTNSGMEDAPITFAVLDRAQPHVLEDEWLMAPGAHRICSFLRSRTRSGVDAEGQPCGGVRSYIVWHQNKWQWSTGGVWLELGESSTSRCPLRWAYLPERASNLMMNSDQAIVELEPLPNRTRRLPLEHTVPGAGK